MGVLWVGTSDIWLRIFFVLSKRLVVFKIESSPVIGPVIMVEAAESRIWVSILWVGSSDVWLWVLSVLSEGLVVLEVEGSPVVIPVVVVE